MKIENGCNFTAVLPGACNAACDFCVDSGSAKIENDWLLKFENILLNLPNEITSISLSGGEPTLSPLFKGAMKLLRAYSLQFDRIVLNTNGQALSKHLIDIGRTFSNINISRHAANADERALIFKTGAIISNSRLIACVESLQGAGVSCSIIAVYDETMSYKKAESLADYARFLEVDELVLRYDYRGEFSQLPNKLEQDLFARYNLISCNSCDACSSLTFDIDGLPVTSKRGMGEPSKQLDRIFELILQQSGELTADWAGNMPVELEHIALNGVISSKIDFSEAYDNNEEERDNIQPAYQSGGCGRRMGTMTGCGR